MSVTPIHFVGYHPPTSVQSRAMTVLDESLKSALGPAVEFRFDSDVASLGRKAKELLDMVETGELDGCYFYSSYLTERVPELGLFELPFQITDRTRAYALLDGPLGERIAASVAANTGYRVLAYWDNGIRHLSNRAHPIRSPADCQGLRIRTAFNELHQATFRALGFEPVAIDVKDLPAAVRDGTVDAQENPLTNVINYNVQQYHRHITTTTHLFGVSVVLANAASYEAWPDAVRRAMADGLREATVAQRTYAAEDDTICRRRLEQDGAGIVDLRADERAAFEHAVSSIVASERSRFPADLLAMFDRGA